MLPMRMLVSMFMLRLPLVMSVLGTAMLMTAAVRSMIAFGVAMPMSVAASMFVMPMIIAAAFVAALRVAVAVAVVVMTMIMSELIMRFLLRCLFLGDRSAQCFLDFVPSQIRSCLEYLEHELWPRLCAQQRHDQFNIWAPDFLASQLIDDD